MTVPVYNRMISVIASLAALKERRHQRKGAPDVAEEYY